MTRIILTMFSVLLFGHQSKVKIGPYMLKKNQESRTTLEQQWKLSLPQFRSRDPTPYVKQLALIWRAQLYIHRPIITWVHTSLMKFIGHRHTWPAICLFMMTIICVVPNKGTVCQPRTRMTFIRYTLQLLLAKLVTVCHLSEKERFIQWPTEIHCRRFFTVNIPTVSRPKEWKFRIAYITTHGIQNEKANWYYSICNGYWRGSLRNHLRSENIKRRRQSQHQHGLC